MRVSFMPSVIAVEYLGSGGRDECSCRHMNYLYNIRDFRPTPDPQLLPNSH